MIAIIDYGAGNIFSVKMHWTIWALKINLQIKHRI